MYFYHGNKHYYLTRILIHDNDLKEALYLLDLSNGEFEDLCYSLGDSLWNKMDDFIKNNSLSANEFYDNELKKKEKDNTYTSTILDTIQASITGITHKDFIWQLVTNKLTYVGVLKSLLYGSIKHFFYEHKELYLPQYDWYLINQNPKRKDIMNVIFKEYDKLSTVAEAIQYYQDPDDIPVEFLIRLQEITGFTINTYNIFTADQIRNLTKHLIDVWRSKSSLYSIELFFACMGIDCSLSELWFDRRFYNNPEAYNSYTHTTSTNVFEYYLTPNDPQNTSYSYSDENVNYSMYTSPRPSRLWNYVLKNSKKETGETVRDLLGYSGNEEITYTFFKSNYLLLDFNYVNNKNTFDKNTIAVFKELIDYMLPAYMRTMYVADFGAESGEEDWDIFYTIDINNSDQRNIQIKSIKDSDGNERPVELFKFFDTQNRAYVDSDGNILQDSETGKGSLLTDFYPADLIGTKNFVSGTFSIIHDTRLETFIEKNPNYDWKSTASSGLYDTVDGEAPGFGIDASYPPFYDDEGYNYFYDSEEGKLVKDDGEWYEAEDGSWIKSKGTVGDLVVEKVNDDSELWDGNKITRYFFQVNGSDTEIYPNLFVENNNGSGVLFHQSEEEPFAVDIEPQVEFIDRETFDPDYTDKPQNLFETSAWREEASAINDLYDEEDTFIGDIQYEYYDYFNPIQNIDANLSEPITITLI